MVKKKEVKQTKMHHGGPTRSTGPIGGLADLIYRAIDGTPGPKGGKWMTLQKFQATVHKHRALNEAELGKIVDQAMVLINDVYVHLPMKRAMHAIDPVQRLRLLKYRLGHQYRLAGQQKSNVEAPRLIERWFHNEMISIFTELRDLHTNYLLPEPYRSNTAFLPFLLEEFFEPKDVRQYLVSKVASGFTHPTFKPGVVVTHWNGVPIDRAVDLNGDRNAGSNEAARHARGLESLTIRPLMTSFPPDEEWVKVSYVTEDETKAEDERKQEIRFEWTFFQPDPAPGAADPISGERASLMGIDVVAEAGRRAKKILFNQDARGLEERMAGKPAPTDSTNESKMPDVLSFCKVPNLKGPVGYIRIWTFDVEDVEAFLQEVIRILALLPQNGLILDVRGNGGGNISAGERMLQLFTQRTIQPELLQFINTPVTLEITRSRVSLLGRWSDSIAEAVVTGEHFSQGFPLEKSAEKYNDPNLKYKYKGPVVLITDASIYSTTDIFAAGFQDHEIGLILSTAANTGAGGANVWTLDLLREFAGKTGRRFKSMPNNTSFRVAVRRLLRVGAKAGVPVEALGVKPDKIYQLKKEDLTGRNIKLIEEACKMLDQAEKQRKNRAAMTAVGR